VPVSPTLKIFTEIAQWSFGMVLDNNSYLIAKLPAEHQHLPGRDQSMNDHCIRR
jgi:hypothetical protein